MAVDFFLKIDGIPGESHDHKHKDEIDIQSWSWGESQQGVGAAGGGHGAGKVAMQDFHFTMHTNKASPKLILACASGEHIKKAVLVCRKAGKDQQEYLTVTFTDILVSSYSTGGHGGGGGDLTMDQIALNFAKIEYEYKPQKQDGSLDAGIKTGWNVKENKKV